MNFAFYFSYHYNNYSSFNIFRLSLIKLANNFESCYENFLDNVLKGIIWFENSKKDINGSLSWFMDIY